MLKRDHETFLIANENEKVEVPAEKVDAIVITANALISTQAVRLCIERNIQLVIADWAGRPVGRFWVSTAGKNTEIRRKQYLNQETSVAFDISLEVTATKLRRQRKFLIDLKHNRKSTNSDLETAISSITASISRPLRDIGSSVERTILMARMQRLL